MSSNLNASSQLFKKKEGRWLSGLRRRSWKPKSLILAWVRIPFFPLELDMFIKKDLSIRNNFYNNELSLAFLRKLSKSNKISPVLKGCSQSLLALNNRSLNVVRYRNFCTFTRKPRAIIRNLKVSFLFLKENLGKFRFNGIKKSSW